MIEPQSGRRPTCLLSGQPFNPVRLFTDIFIPEALVRTNLVSAGTGRAN